ncbi:MAG: hypothetical protein HY332_12680 [Chloroflexi bacterium]|nr:hypothetical protein [Chloroflexota bacterium]
MPPHPWPLSHQGRGKLPPGERETTERRRRWPGGPRRRGVGGAGWPGGAAGGAELTHILAGGIHPNEAGYAIIFDAFRRALDG